MIYEHFNLRLHASEYQQQEPSSWLIKVGDGVLSDFVVGSITNPKPTVKKNSLDILGTSGEVDLTEESGRVFFENKTVTVILQGRADFAGMEEVESFFAPYQGRLMDFTNENYLSVTGFQVGRMAAEFDRKKNRITIVFDTDPYRYSEIVYQKTLPLLTDYEVDQNDSAWTTYGRYNPDISADSVTHFVFFSDGTMSGAVHLERTKPVGAASGYFALGISSILGGDIWFSWVEDGEEKTSKTIAGITADATLGENAQGYIKMHILIDGSYYEWATVNGERVYLPCIRCDYSLTNYLPTNADSELTSACSDTLPSNILIRPYVHSTNGYAFLIVDGVKQMVYYAENEQVPRIVIAGDRADRSSANTQTVFAAISAAIGSTPNPKLIFRKAEVF